MQNRPWGVALISILVGIEAILQIIAGLALFGMTSFALFSTPYTGAVTVILVIGVIALIIGIVELVVASAMWSMERWAWILTVIICWIDLVFDIINAFVNAQTFGAALLSMIIPLIVLIYFYQDNVRKAFGK